MLAGGGRAWEDAPVRADLLDSLRGRGWSVRVVLKWGNLVSATPSRSDASLPACVEPAAQVAQVVPEPRAAPVAARAVSVDPSYVTLRRMHETLGVAALQDSLRSRGIQPGEGVRVAVIDDGFIRRHNVLDGSNILDAWDFASGDSMPWAEGEAPWSWDHGTATAGLVASQWDLTLPGIAPSAELLLYRSEDDAHETYAEEDYLAAAIERAVEHGARVITTSLGYRYWYDASPDHPFSELDGKTLVASRTASWAAGRDVVVVASIGNEGDVYGSRTVNSPADADSILAVGAVSEGGLRCRFSSMGPTADGRIKPELAAYGCTIPVATGDGLDAYSDGGNGTSYATPLVAGMAVLLRQMRPSWTAMQVRDSLLASGSNASSPDTLLGWGVPDLRRIASLVEPVRSYSRGVPHLRGVFGTMRSGCMTENVAFELRGVDGRLLLARSVERGAVLSFAAPPPGLYLATWKGSTIDGSRLVVVPDFP